MINIISDFPVLCLLVCILGIVAIILTRFNEDHIIFKLGCTLLAIGSSMYLVQHLTIASGMSVFETSKILGYTVQSAIALVMAIILMLGVIYFIYDDLKSKLKGKHKES